MNKNKKWLLDYKTMLLLTIIISIISCKNEVKNLNSNQIKYDSLVKVGSNSFQKGDYNNAIINLKNAIKLNNDYSIGKYRLGVVYTASSDKNIRYVDSALNLLNNIYTKDSNYERVNYNLGICYMIKDDYNTALKYLNKGFEKDSLDSDVFFNRGLTNLNLKDTIKACIDFNSAKELGDLSAIELINKYCN